MQNGYVMSFSVLPLILFFCSFSRSDSLSWIQHLSQLPVQVSTKWIVKLSKNVNRNESIPKRIGSRYEKVNQMPSAINLAILCVVVVVVQRKRTSFRLWNRKSDCWHRFILLFVTFILFTQLLISIFRYGTHSFVLASIY